MGRLSIECERARLWASLEADAEITELEQAALDAHLRDCLACAEQRRHLVEVVRLVRAAPTAEPGRPLVLAPRGRRGHGRLHLAASVAAVVAALAFGGLAGTLSSSGGSGSPEQSAASHRLLIQQSLLALMAATPPAERGHGRLFPS